jgi:hypothetical protein
MCSEISVDVLELEQRGKDLGWGPIPKNRRKTARSFSDFADLHHGRPPARGESPTENWRDRSFAEPAIL